MGDQWGAASSMDFYHDTLFVVYGDTADGQFVNNLAKFIGSSYVDSCGAPVGISAIAPPDRTVLLAWPDASGNWTVAGAAPGMQPVFISDAAGRVTLRALARVPTDTALSIDVGVLAPGAYVIRIGDRSAKVLVQ